MTLPPAVRRRAGAVLALGLLVALGACDDDADPPGAGATPSDVPSETPSSDPTPTEPTSTPTPELDPDVACLVSGSPWVVAVHDLESQFPAVLRGIDVTDVTITGPQTLTVGPGLEATFTPNRSTRVVADAGGGLTMVLVQRQQGSASGVWQLGEGKLTSAEPWSGNLSSNTTVSINGSAVEAPLRLPAGGLGDAVVTFSCAPNELMMQVEGSPFSYLFR